MPDISISNAMIRPATGRTNSSGPIKRINYVGRLSSEKQPLWVFEIAKETGLPIRIFGDGLLREKLQDFGSKNGLNAQFEGFVLNPWEFFTENDLLIIPSSFEGDGLVIIEAISNRIPFIANDISDLRRFNFKDNNYAMGVDQFTDSINAKINSIEYFLPEESTICAILSDRDPAAVGRKWISFLNSLG
jgi:glycosyltransferase involved in cell wall biosynthesis